MFCSSAHICHWRVTEPVESTRTPSRSKRTAAQLNVVIKEFFWFPARSPRQCLRGVGHDYELSLGYLVANLHVPFAEVRAGALSPSAHEIIVQAGADHRAGKRNDPSRPLFDHFRAGLRSNALDDSGHEPADHFFLQQLAADVDTGSAGSCNPQFRGFLFSVEFEAVEQAEFLNGPQSHAG